MKTIIKCFILSTMINLLIVLYISGNIQFSTAPVGKPHNWDAPKHFWSMEQ